MPASFVSFWISVLLRLWFCWFVKSKIKWHADSLGTKHYFHRDIFSMNNSLLVLNTFLFLYSLGTTYGRELK